MILSPATLLLTTLAIVLTTNTVDCQFQRLVQPYSGSKMTMAPGLSFPSVQLSTIESAFNMRLPITVQFPTAAEAAQQFFVQVISMPLHKGAASLTQQQQQQQKTQQKSSTTTAEDDKTAKTRSAMRTARVNSRTNFYETLETVHESLGKSCLLRAICEVAEVPFVAANTGFIGEMIDILLSAGPLIDSATGKMSEYLKAEKIGRESLLAGSDGCKKKYGDCPFSLFKVVQLANEVL